MPTSDTIAGGRELRATGYEQPAEDIRKGLLEARGCTYGNLCASPGTVFTMSLKITITANSTMKTNAA
jgi:hypothetical protein